MIAVTRTWALAVSLLVHVIGIALLSTIRFPEPLRPRPSRFTLIGPHFRMAPPPVRPRALRWPVPPPVPPLRSTMARAFHVPGRLPELLPPQPALTIPDPPSVHPPEIELPRFTPLVVERPLAPPVKAAGFSSIETGPASLERRPPPAVGAFDPATVPSQAMPHAAALSSTTIRSGAFGDASVAAAEPRASGNAAFANFSAAEILFKPRPAYTDEARRLQIEGEVLLEVLFGASGEARVLRTIRALGHGLDENAISAAREIRFRPARRGGAPVDSLAVVHIVFQVAY